VSAKTSLVWASSIRAWAVAVELFRAALAPAFKGELEETAVGSGGPLGVWDAEGVTEVVPVVQAGRSHQNLFFLQVVERHYLEAGDGGDAQQGLAKAGFILSPKSRAIRPPGGHRSLHTAERFRCYRVAVEITEAKNNAQASDPRLKKQLANRKASPRSPVTSRPCFKRLHRKKVREISGYDIYQPFGLE
jgi:hypothetical protein